MKVAVIGAGASGLASLKCCIDEGLEPVCFEQEDTIGGLWKFTEEERHSSVYRSTVINTSKEMMCFSDFPIPKEFPPFMHNSHVMKYFELYASHFDLYKYIRFRTKVVDIRKAADYEDTGNWEVCYANVAGEGNKVKIEIYNGVMVCIGHHSSPRWPSFQGMNEFAGDQIHSHAYKDFKRFQDKSVLVLGIGNSGGDIAVELSRYSSQVYLSTRKGAWVLSRLHQSGVPIDFWANRRLLSTVPNWLRRSLMKSQINAKFDHFCYGLEPDHGPFQQHPMVNDDIANRIINGTVIIKPNVDHFTESGVHFDDGTSISDLDAVIFCTGYDIGFQFIDKSIISIEENEVTLYKYVFPPHLPQATLAVIGCFQPLGAINPVAELQCRWVTRVFKGVVRLPTERDMMRDIDEKKSLMKQRYYSSRRHTIQVDYIPFSDEIANLIGCKPSISRLFLSDPVLALRCIIGPCVPAQYRLSGPGVWPGAREAIMSADINIMYSTKTRTVKRDEQVTLTTNFFLFLAIVLILIAYACTWI